MALSGSTSKAYTPKGAYWIWIEWSATQDILANQSTITAILYIGTNSYGYYTTNDNESKITIDGVTASFGDSGDVGYNTTKKEISRYTRTVSHNSDGTKSLTLTGWQRLSDTYQLTTTGTITLDTIPRASLITS
ncbi:MAG: DUF859 domain-containing protein, partial [Youngiibacter sp.]|nr:DUF859 domain-containing protein [Youngiibacter sp.]